MVTGRSFLYFMMIRLILVSLFGLTLAQFGIPNVYLTPTDQSHFNIWSNLQGLRDFQWSRIFPTCPEEIKSITEIEKQIDEHLKRAETTCAYESACEEQGNKHFCAQYKIFLQNICSALDSVRNMVVERKIACNGKENELKDLHKLLAVCARTRVKLLKDRDIYKEAVKRVLTNPNSNEINSFNGTLVEEELSVNGTSNSTEENIQENTSELNSIDHPETTVKEENMQEYTSEFNSSNHPETTVKEENNEPEDRKTDIETDINPVDENRVQFKDVSEEITPKTYNILTLK